MTSSDLGSVFEAMARFTAEPITLRGSLIANVLEQDMELLIARRGDTWRIAPRTWPAGLQVWSKTIVFGHPGPNLSSVPKDAYRWMPTSHEALLRYPLSLVATHALRPRSDVKVAERSAYRVEA